jgi:hypothetical protein
MKQLKIMGRWAGLFTALILSLVATTTPAAAGPIVIDFGILGITDSGSISYAGGKAPLVGTDIAVDIVFGRNTPEHASPPDLPLACVDCVLSFTTGAFLGLDADTGKWRFDEGGSIKIIGSVPDAGIDDAVTLLEGHFTGKGPGAPGVVFVGPADPANPFKLAFGGFFDVKDKTLLNYFGLTDGPFHGGLNIQFTTPLVVEYDDDGNPVVVGGVALGDSFTSDSVLGGDVSNRPLAVPAPIPVVLLGAGLVALALWTRRVGENLIAPSD